MSTKILSSNMEQVHFLGRTIDLDVKGNPVHKRIAAAALDLEYMEEMAAREFDAARSIMAEAAEAIRGGMRPHSDGVQTAQRAAEYAAKVQFRGEELRSLIKLDDELQKEES